MIILTYFSMENLHVSESLFEEKKNIIKVFNLHGNKATREYNTHGMNGFYINFKRKYGKVLEKYRFAL